RRADVPLTRRGLRDTCRLRNAPRSAPSLRSRPAVACVSAPVSWSSAGSCRPDGKSGVRSCWPAEALERAKFIVEAQKHYALWEIEALVRERWTLKRTRRWGPLSPILVGGGSRPARRRAARLGQAGRDHQA